MKLLNGSMKVIDGQLEFYVQTRGENFAMPVRMMPHEARELATELMIEVVRLEQQQTENAVLDRILADVQAAPDLTSRERAGMAAVSETELPDRFDGRDVNDQSWR